MLDEAIFFFGDKRLLATGQEFISCIIEKVNLTVHQIAPDWNAEISFGRFLRNARVNIRSIKCAFMDNSTVLNDSCRGRSVLLVEDTSALSFGDEPRLSGLGKIGSGTSNGFYMHPVIGLDARDGNCLGLAEVQVFQRKSYAPDDPMHDKKYRQKECQKLPFEEKESHRWLSAVKTALKRTPDAVRHTVIADRECDIYEALCGYADLKCDFVIRTQYLDRRLNKTRTGPYLYGELDDMPVQGTYTLQLPATDKRSAHEATLEIKFGSVVLARPKTGLVKHLRPILRVNIVEVKECPESVANNEQAVHRVLITSHEIENVRDAQVIVRYYRWRWVIEQVFGTLKSQGLNIEKTGVKTYERASKLAIMALIAAVKILQLVQARDGSTQSVESVFTPTEIEVLEKLNPRLEGKTEKSKNPFQKENLAYASWIMARLGGWKGYKSQRPPGPIIMKTGLIKFKSIVEGFNLRI